MNKPFYNISLLRFFFYIHILIFYSCSGNQQNAKTKNDFPAYVITAYMDGCMAKKKDGEQALICSCLMDKIQVRYSYEQYKVISKMEGEEYNEYKVFLKEAAKDCIKENNSNNK